MEILRTTAENPWITDILVFCLGACAGSFLNVCICRIPAGESVVSPPSHCVCGKAIPPWLNIPVLSWFMLGGRAKCCGARISFRHPLVESLTALAFVFLWRNFDLCTASAGMLFFCLMVFCAFVDIDTMELPDAATVGGTLAGVLFSAAFPSLHSAGADGTPFILSAAASLASSVTGAVAGAGVLYLLRLFSSLVFGREAVGEGDVILSACIGAFCGWKGAVFAVFGGSVVGCAVLLPAILFSGMFSPSRGNAGEKNVVPFGPWLASGALLYFLFLRPFVDAYFGCVAGILSGA